MSVHATTFDTLQYTKRAKEAGLSDKEAEFHAEEIAKVIKEQDDNLVTKDFLKAELSNMTWRIISVLGALITILSFYHH